MADMMTFRRPSDGATITVTIRPGKGTEVFDVFDGMRRIGSYMRVRATFERGPKDAPYVTRRWTSKRWHYLPARSTWPRERRHQAIAQVIRDHMGEPTIHLGSGIWEWDQTR